MEGQELLASKGQNAHSSEGLTHLITDWVDSQRKKKKVMMDHLS